MKSTTIEDLEFKVGLLRDVICDTCRKCGLGRIMLSQRGGMQISECKECCRKCVHFAQFAEYEAASTDLEDAKMDDASSFEEAMAELYGEDEEP